MILSFIEINYKVGVILLKLYYFGKNIVILLCEGTYSMFHFVYYS